MSLEQEVERIEEIFEFAGKTYTKEQFANENEIDAEDIDAVIAVLVTQGKIKCRTEGRKQTGNKIIENAIKEAKLLKQSVEIEEDAELEYIKKIHDKRVGRHVYPKVSFEFPNLEQSREFVNNVNTLMLRSEVTVNIETGFYDVVVFELTDKELDNLSLIYKANKAVKSAVMTVDNTVSKAVQLTDYTAKKIVTPLTKITLGGILNIGKSALTTATKIGSIAVTETIRTTKETASAIKHDDNITVARAELYKTKSEIQSMIGRDKYSTSGIKIER